MSTTFSGVGGHRMDLHGAYNGDDMYSSQLPELIYEHSCMPLITPLKTHVLTLAETAWHWALDQ